MDAQVDLNPHQVEAALFAFRSPLSKGAILADEVGLGKTIEAGLVLSQKWAERKRRILIITPASLRKQWVQEMQDKFFLPAMILESKNYNKMVRDNVPNPFEQNELVVCSYHFAARRPDELRMIPWDLVIIDEAHRLRNVYKPSNKIGRALKDALEHAPKVLLTATPLQNSLMELYGLVSIIDDYAFGDVKSFRAQYARLTGQDTFTELQERLKAVCHRTLRRQVLEYVRYTDRLPITREFVPSAEEQSLYDQVSEYLRRPSIYALPRGQRTLMVLILRKLLASSTFAIAGALDTLARKLEAQIKADAKLQVEVQEELAADYEELDEVADEWEENGDDSPDLLSPEDIAAIKVEIADLTAFRDLATSITENTRGQALLEALTAGFAKARELGSAEKAIIFTESRRTQEYLWGLLSRSGYDGKLVLFSGTNTDTHSKGIYTKWVEANQGSDRITGSRTADMRAALVDHFRDSAQIMIATEAAAEGINLQFCSMVVNYDLPWNPQRIEQRIGRCHRYGQQHDVVVVNFLNKKNAADQRVYQLLDEKFQLFSGVFGASDEVLGSIESGVEFEKRIVEIHQTCRTPEEIDTAFNQLRAEMDAQISETMEETRRKLLEHFDEEVHERLRVSFDESKEYRDRFERMLWELTRFELGEHVEFLDEQGAFRLNSQPFLPVAPDVPLGLYELPRRTGSAHLYRLGHPLAAQVLAAAKERTLLPAEVTFDYSGHPTNVAVLEPYVGKSGRLLLSQFTVESLDQAEDHLLFVAVTDDGEVVDEDAARRLFKLPMVEVDELLVPVADDPLQQLTEQRRSVILQEISERNAAFFEAEAGKLDGWADDLKVALERDIKEMDRQIKEAKRAATLALSLEEKLAGQKQIKELESKRNTMRRSLFEAQDDIDARRELLINEIEGKLEQKTSSNNLLEIRWTVV